MSCPIVSSAARRLTRTPSRPVISALSPSRPAWSTFSARFCDSASPRPLLPQIVSQKTQISRNVSLRNATPFLTPRHRRAFSASTVHRATQATLNPRTGEDGNTLMVEISPRAAERLREITDPSSSPSATKEENPYHHLRITVTSGGCHGFQYMMSLEAASKIDPEEDTVFEAEYTPEEGSPQGPGDAKVVMDEPSLELLSGSKVDYTMELIGSQFKIVDNPRATSNCGCGTSFDVSD
ncbi:HesB/IscA family protein [Aspergillus melleus]|uniref:HesB/IscA family protein n=1 Tax=Aspergillus melleus TaxID=138277 RepID=UPI001E8E4F35|nr:[4Fe-4S] proteins maturation [Aspergillus melleus]KAH8424515.1 [4Fe-4S] proteins maturation [Aspergillus melleus]